MNNKPIHENRHLRSQNIKKGSAAWAKPLNPPRCRRHLRGVLGSGCSLCQGDCTVTFTVSPESLQVTMAGESHFSDFIPFLLGSHARSFCECAQLSSETPPQEGQCAKTHRRGALRLSRRRTLFRGVPDHFFGLKSIVPSQCDFGGARCAHDGAKVAPRCPQWAPRITFGEPWRHFWRPKWRNAVYAKNVLFIVF